MRKRAASAFNDVVGAGFVALSPIPTTATYSLAEKCELTRMPQILLYCCWSGLVGSRASNRLDRLEWDEGN